MAEPARMRVTVDEFLAFEGERDRHYQLIAGEILMMAPAMRAHRLMAIKLGAALQNRLRLPCQAESEAGILLPWTSHDFFEADIVVSCTPGQLRSPWCPDPILIVEILSPSTEQVDRTVKLPAYRRLDSARHILLVSAERPAIEHYARAGRFWHLQDLGQGDILGLDALKIEIPVAEIYGGIAFEAIESAP